MRTDIRVPWVGVLAVPLRGRTAVNPKKYHGDGRDILLQGFHWESHRGATEPGSGGRKSWYRIISENAATIRQAGFTWVWLPPPSDSLAPQGYIPRRWDVLDTTFGSEAELRAAIHALGPVKAMADIVLNHRVGVSTPGADFADPAFPDNRAAIVRDDESGVGTGNPDTGDRHPCGRDLDHTNPDVRTAIKKYLNRLREVGFHGWRYDLSKGYHGRFVGEYNEATGPGLSVGEFFDGDRQKVTDWIDATGDRSTAFDFPTRFLLYEACKKDDFAGLRSTVNGRVMPGGLIGFWPSRAVTFLDNHDTEYRRDRDPDHSCTGVKHFEGCLVPMAYAYLLTHPGIPCVFWSHFFEWGDAHRWWISQLMTLRRSAGLHAGSAVDIRAAGKGLYAAVIDGRVAVKLGQREWSPGGGWVLALAGERCAVWLRG
jgi:alpha-amylase